MGSQNAFPPSTLKNKIERKHHFLVKIQLTDDVKRLDPVIEKPSHINVSTSFKPYECSFTNPHIVLLLLT